MLEPEDMEEKLYSEIGIATANMISQQLWLPALNFCNTGPNNSQSWIMERIMCFYSFLINYWEPMDSGEMRIIVFNCVTKKD